MTAQPTPRQINNANNLKCETVEFEGRTLTTLEAVVLDDELVALSHETLKPSDYARRSALKRAIWAAHRAAVKAANAPVIAAALAEVEARKAAQAHRVAA